MSVEPHETFTLTLSNSVNATFNAQNEPQDAVGFAASAPALCEGGGSPDYPTTNAEHAWMRDYDGPFPRNTVAGSSQDFVFVATTGTAVTGSPVNLTPQLGAAT